MVFHNRSHAADRLAVALEAYKGTHPLILAIPRGAVTMGQRLAQALGGEVRTAPYALPGEALSLSQTTTL